MIHMKRIFSLLLTLSVMVGLVAQTPTKKWNGSASDNWDYLDANWMPIAGLPIPTTFAAGEDVLLDDTRAEGKDTVIVNDSIVAANITFDNTVDAQYVVMPGDIKPNLAGEGAIYKTNTGEVILNVPTQMEGGIIVNDGYISGTDDYANCDMFGEKVTLNGGGIKINHTPSDNPTFLFGADVEVPDGQTGTIVMSRRVNMQGKYTGAGTLNIISKGERNYIDLAGGTDWSEFTGQLNVIKDESDVTYGPGFYGFILQTDSNYVPEFDEETGLYTESGIDAGLKDTKINLGSGSTLSSWSGTKCYEIGELTADDESVEIWGYAKKSTTPQIYYRLGSLNTDFVLPARFTGEQGDKTNPDSYRRYNAVGLIKVGTGTMTLTNGRQYITAGIFVLDGKLFISNAEGTSTGTGWLSEGIPLYVGPEGTLGGTGLVSRNVENHGVVAPGENGVGTLTIADSLNAETKVPFTLEMMETGTLEIQLGSTESFDKLIADSIITGGTLKVVLAANYDIKEGDSFKIIESMPSVKSAGFASIELPKTDDGWTWDTSLLESDGTISLTAGGGNNTAIENVTVDNLINIWPNPNKGSFNLDVNADITVSSMKVISLTGALVYTEQFNTGVSQRVNMGNLNAGLYLVELNTSKGKVIKKVTVK